MYHADKKDYMIDMNKHIIGLSKKKCDIQYIFRGEITVLKGWNNFKKLHTNTK